MKCTLAHAKSLKRIIDLLKELTNVLYLVVDANGWNLDAVDASRVAFAQLHLPPAAFSEYEVVSPFILGLNRAALAMALHCAGDADRLQLAYEAGAPCLSIVTFTPTKGYVRSGTFNVPLIDVEKPDLKLPDPTHDCAMPLNAVRFASDCALLKDFDEKVTLTADPGGTLTLSNDRNMRMNQKACIEWKAADTPAPVSGTYALAYLNKFVGAMALCSTVQVGFSRDALLYLVYAIDGGGHLTYVLAPKM